jgi:hypothetical protein
MDKTVHVQCDGPARCPHNLRLCVQSSIVRTILDCAMRPPPPRRYRIRIAPVDRYGSTRGPIDRSHGHITTTHDGLRGPTVGTSSATAALRRPHAPHNLAVAAHGRPPEAEAELPSCKGGAALAGPALPRRPGGGKRGGGSQRARATRAQSRPQPERARAAQRAESRPFSQRAARARCAARAQGRLCALRRPTVAAPEHPSAHALGLGIGAATVGLPLPQSSGSAPRSTRRARAAPHAVRFPLFRADSRGGPATHARGVVRRAGRAAPGLPRWRLGRPGRQEGGDGVGGGVEARSWRALGGVAEGRARNTWIRTR